MLLDLDLTGRFPVVELAPVQLGELLLERLVDVVRAAASDRPFVMVVEDLQWADPTTLELLDRVAAATVRTRLLILGTARPGLAWVQGRDRALHIRLGPLPDAEARQLALAAAPDQISVDDAQEIAARGDGVPLFIEELAHAFGGGLGCSRRHRSPDAHPAAAGPPGFGWSFEARRPGGRDDRP